MDRYHLSSLACDQCLCLVNTGQLHEAWLASGREVLALSLRRQASRNRRVGLGTVPTQVAHELRNIAREQSEVAIISYHALYAYAMLAAAQYPPLDLAPPIATITCPMAYPVVCIDQAGFAVVVRVLSPVDYLGYADEASGQVVRAMLDSGLLAAELPTLVSG